MAFVHHAGALGFGTGIDPEDMRRRISPVGALVVGIEQADIVGEVILVIGGKPRRVGRAILEMLAGHNAPVPPVPVNLLDRNGDNSMRAAGMASRALRNGRSGREAVCLRCAPANLLLTLIGEW
ncbi:hypothetical protein [Caballeronia sp. PC1]|uniref:hypothetical protein n=1 Tax=Caballeronia sp. PC1 TaxID=2906765 RepID=UPI0035C87704